MDGVFDANWKEVEDNVKLMVTAAFQRKLQISV